MASWRDEEVLASGGGDEAFQAVVAVRPVVRELTTKGVRVQFLRTAHLHGRGHRDGEPATVGHGRVRQIRTRPHQRNQREGIALAKKRGAYRGRRRSLSEEQVAQLPPTSRPGCREDDAGPRTQNQPRDRVPVPAHHTR